MVRAVAVVGSPLDGTRARPDLNTFACCRNRNQIQTKEGGPDRSSWGAGATSPGVPEEDGRLSAESDWDNDLSAVLAELPGSE